MTTRASVVRVLMILVSVAVLTIFLLLPLAVVFSEALKQGLHAFTRVFHQAEARSAIWLTLAVAVIAVPVNMVFGVAAAWLMARFEFRGKALLGAFIDLPFSVSPVISGMAFVLLFGAQGWFGPWLIKRNLGVIFAVPGLVLATVFVTLPFIARELIPLMQAQGSEEEEAARVLGAGSWQMFFRVTLPNIRWALLYGVLLCNARAMGEFGAVSVVSGHIRNLTTTMPLEVEMRYNEYDYVGAFAVASLLALLAVLTLAFKALMEWRYRHELAAGGAHR